VRNTRRYQGGGPEAASPGDASPEDATPPGDPSIRRLLVWYPRAWRARYGEEFAELLAAERAERGPSFRRGINVATTGVRARLAGAGLAAHPLDGAAAGQAGLAVVAACTAAAVLAGSAMWAQLAIGVQWSVPRDHRVTQALDLMSAALLVLVLLAVLAGAPVAWAALASAARGQARQFRLPAAFMTAGLVVLVIGSRHFENGWPGTGGHLLLHQGLVPGGVAAFAWAGTTWITSYWAHPAALGAFPAAELAWMLVSPAATGVLMTGAVQLLRRVRLSPRAFRYEIRLANLACAGMTAFPGGALCWLAAAGAGTAGPFRTGAIDRAAVAVLIAAALVGALAVWQARAAARSGRGQALTAPRP
jgi:hypothetical protein